MKKLLFSLTLITAVLCGCSEHTNDSKYRSNCPRFGEMSFSTEEVIAGKPVTITCMERREGKLLNTTIYNWFVSPAGGVVVEPSAAENGVYDGKNPFCTITFPTPGTYTVTFRADYAGSGQVNYFQESETLQDGTKATYSANTVSETSPQRDYLHAELTRRVFVK